MSRAKLPRLRSDHRQLLQDCERALLAQGTARSTRASQRSTVRKFLVFVRRRVDRVRPGDVERFLAARSVRVSPSMIEGDFYRLRTFFRTLVQLGVVDANPLDLLHCPRATHPAPVLLSEAQVQRLLTLASEPVPGGAGIPLALRNRALLELLYGAGLRSCEACRVKVTDLDMARGELAIRPAKGGVPRRVPFPEAALPYLERYLQAGRALLGGGRGRDLGAFLLGRHGGPLKPEAVRQVVKRLVARLGGGDGRDPHPHAFRRAIATHLARSGASVLAVQALLGHRELTTTQRYMEVEWGDLVQAVATLETRPGPRGGVGSSG